VRGGSLFRNLARMSAAGLPVVTVTHGSSTAGGAYQTGLSDYIIMVRGRSRAFLAGPPLLKAATGEIATEEELGGAEMHTTISGLGDYLAEDDRDALRIAREMMAQIDWPRKPAPRALQAAALRRRGTAGHHADGPQAPGRHEAGDRAHRRRLRLPRVRPNYGPPPSAAMPASKAMRWASSPTTARSTRRRHQGHALHPGLLPERARPALPEQHHRLHGGQGYEEAA
jgi:hypothetical protein